MTSNNATRRHKRSKLPASLFTTERLSPDERFAAWRDSIGVIMDVRLTNPAETRFDARVESYLFEDIVATRCSASGQKFDRNAAKISRDSIDHYMIQLFLSGDVMTRYRGRDTKTNAGSIVAFDFLEVMDTYNSDFDLLSMIIPRRRLAPLLQRPDGLQGVQIDTETGAGRILSNYMVTLFSVAPSLTPAEGSGAVRSLLDLIALAFNSAALATGDIPELAHQAELMRVQNFIKDNLHRQDLEPETVAAGVCMSRAALYRLFAPTGGVAEYIREQRLRRSLADLLSAQQAHRQIADIAYSWGFRDPVNFAKIFKQRFGRTPSDAREAGTAAMKSEPSGVDTRVGDRLYEQWIAGLA